MNQDQLRGIAAAIQHELELARAGEGYEEKDRGSLPQCSVHPEGSPA